MIHEMRETVVGLWGAAEGAAQLAEWVFDPDDPSSTTRARARSMLDDLVRATRDVVPWGEPESTAHRSPERLLAILDQSIAQRPGDDRLFRLALRQDDIAAPYTLSVEWASRPTGRLPDYDEVAASLDAAALYLRELVESPRFGRGRLEDLAELEGVEPTDVEPDDAFELRAEQPPDEDSFTNRLEQALGVINGLVFRRRDHTQWGDRIRATLDDVGGMADERLGEPWCEEILLELRMILLCRTFPTSRNEEVEKLRPLVARVEAILRAGGLVYGARGAAVESSVLLACPGPGEP